MPAVAKFSTLMLGGALLSLAALAGCGDDASDTPAPAKELSKSDVAKIEKLMETPPFNHGVWGVVVTDQESGRQLYRRNITRKFQAASTTKNFTTAATLDILGKDHRFHTPVVHTGKVSSGRLAGDLVLVASGDLTMGGRAQDEGGVDFTGFDHTDANEVPGPATLTPGHPLAGLDDLARQVKESGVERVGGDIVIDDRLWRARKVVHEVVSPIIINDNLIDVLMTPTTPGKPVRTRTLPETKAYDMDVRVKTVPRGGTTDVNVGEARGRKVVVTGTLEEGTKPVPFVQVFRVPEPAYFARTLFIEALRRQGIEVNAPAVAPDSTKGLPSRSATAKLPRVAELTSPPVSEFAKLINKVSHNLGANTAPFWLGVKADNPTFEGGMRQIRQYVRKAGAKPGQFTLVDGQGGPGNVISPAAMVQVLRYTQNRPYAEAFIDSLPIKGVDGLPEDPEKDPATGHVFNKNGVNGALDANGDIEVQAMALAGFVESGPRRLAFDLVANHVPILPNGRSSGDPEKLVAAFTRFGSHEAITTRLYESQR